MHHSSNNELSFIYFNKYSVYFLNFLKWHSLLSKSRNTLLLLVVLVAVMCVCVCVFKDHSVSKNYPQLKLDLKIWERGK